MGQQQLDEEQYSLAM
ncbi:hypothetical protein M6B38_106655 [Iris pallida]|uniref:Uncharacterized protein n=1 Tax=Iris pallida TaxID=29817 RepID=A0AAX6ESH5_IRIPA|nr:hypothetical protein M6B38_106655 [Iris pallida]